MRSIITKPPAYYPRQEKTITSSRERQIVVPDDGYYLSKVTAEKYPDANGTYVAPLRANNNDMGPYNNFRYVDTTGLGQEKSAIPSNAQQIITPDSGKYLSKVTIAKTPTQEKEATPSSSQVVVTPDNGKFLSKVTVKAIATEEKVVDASRSNQVVTPSSGKLLSKVTVNKYPDASGEYRCPSNWNGEPEMGLAGDMGATNNIRYVNATNVYSTGYNQGKLDGRIGSLSGYIQIDLNYDDYGDRHQFGLAMPSGCKWINCKATLNEGSFINYDPSTGNYGDSIQPIIAWGADNPVISLSSCTGSGQNLGINGIVYALFRFGNGNRSAFTKISYTLTFHYTDRDITVDL